MKGDISAYEDEIIKFFDDKNVNVRVISNELQTYNQYKSEQCCVTIMLKEKPFPCKDTTSLLNALYDSIVKYPIMLATFTLIAMPGCCGIAISTGAHVNNVIQNMGVGQFLHKLRVKIATDWGYGLLLCTDVDNNEAQKHILAKNQWEHIYNFENPRTDNNINIHVLKLNK
jgi:hypothetical protein